MECPTCLELYNDDTKRPRNLQCGHTFCEECLTRLIQETRLACPTCRTYFPSIVPHLLPMNFIAADLARSHLEQIRKVNFCDEHSLQPAKFFCNTCEVSICVECIVDHSGHSFVKQEESTNLLKNRALEAKKTLEDCKARTEKTFQNLDQIELSLQEAFTEGYQSIDQEFDLLQKALNERRELLKQKLLKMCEKSQIKVKKQYEEIKQQAVCIEEAESTVTERLKEISRTQDRDSQVSSLFEEVLELKQKFTKIQEGIQESLCAPILCPSFELERSKALENILSLGNISSELSQNYTVKDPFLCFFGDKNKVMTYDLVNEIWDIKTHRMNLEFNYYSAACTLSDGSVLITGGGSSNAVYHYKNKQIIQKAPMLQPRKEHATVCLNNEVYAIGGYDGPRNSFLSECEKYDLEKDTWVKVHSMNVARCAFSATSVSNRYIYIFGGYDGTQRLGSIEKFNPEINTWVKLDVTLRFPLSNCACFSPEKNKVVILGGGFSSGFSLAVEMFDIETETWHTLPMMSEGRDLRNKIGYFKGNAYCVGGYNFKAEMFNLERGIWYSLPNYLVADNLDSWSCALTYKYSSLNS